MRVAAALGIAAAFLAIVMLGADEHPELALDDAVVFVGVFHDLLADLHVLFERLVAGVDHDTGKPFIDALLAELEGVPVIEMDRDRDVGETDGRLDEFLEVDRVGVLARALGNLEHDRSLFLLAGLYNRLEQLHVVHVEGAEGILPLQRLGKEVSRMCQWHSIVFRLLGIRMPAAGTADMRRY